MVQASTLRPHKHKRGRLRYLGVNITDYAGARLLTVSLISENKHASGEARYRGAILGAPSQGTLYRGISLLL